MVSQASPDIVVVGSANMDVVGRVPHLPVAGETVIGTRLIHAPGGKGANQAVAAARAGSSVAFVGRVGADSYGADLIESLETAGVSTDHLIVDGHHATGVALIMVDDDGGNMIGVLSGANAEVMPADVDAARDVIASARVLVLQLEIPLESVHHAAQMARETETMVILNPAPARALSPELLRQVDILIPNQDEVARLSGLGPPNDPASAAHMLVDNGTDAVIVTLGSEGSVVVTREGDISIPAFSMEAVDTTAAGDAFVGNLAHAVADSASLEEAARFASAAAALSVQREGAQPSMPTRAETEALLEEYQTS